MLHLSTLLKRGFSPTFRDINNLLQFLSSNGRFKAVIHLFSQFSFMEINDVVQTRTIFAKALLKENNWEKAGIFLKTSAIVEKNRVFDSLIQGICISDQNPEKGLSFFKVFLKEVDFFPSSRTFGILLRCFSKISKWDSVIDVMILMSDSRFKYPFVNYALSSVVSGLVRIGKPEIDVRFYETAAGLSYLKPETVTSTTVVIAYCELRDTDKVSELVSWMENNALRLFILPCTSWLYGCLKERLIYEAFRIFRRTFGGNISPGTLDYTMLIDEFSRIVNEEKAFGILYRMKMDGHEPNLLSYNAVIWGFCNNGKLNEALAVFGILKKFAVEVDEFTFAILIHAACREGDLDLVFELLDEMYNKGVIPGVVVFDTFINGLHNVGRISEVKMAEIAIIDTDVVRCNILMKMKLMIALFEDALVIYMRLQQTGLSANSVTYWALINGYCKAGRIDEVLEILDDYLKASSDSSAACYGRIISGLCKKGLVDLAIAVIKEYVDKGFPISSSMSMMLIETVFDKEGANGILEMIYRMELIYYQSFHSVCYNAICFLCKMGFPEISYEILLAMKSKRLSPIDTCYYCILKTLLYERKSVLAELICTCFVKHYGMHNLRVCEIIAYHLCLLDVKKALEFLSMINERKLDVTLPISVFKMLTYDSRHLDAYKILMSAGNSLPRMDAFHYTEIIDGLCKGIHINKALDICYLAKKNGITLNIVTYNAVMNGLCCQGCLIEAFRLFNSLRHNAILPTEVTYGTLIDALVNQGLIVDARRLFDQMFGKNLKPSTRIYNAMMNGYCKSNQLAEATNLFQVFQLEKLEADEFTVAAVINCHFLKGDMEGALEVFFRFKSVGLLPNVIGFMHLLRGLYFKGRIDEARSIARYMLQTQSVIDILKKVEKEVESDSVVNLLSLLCEQGRITEAIAIFYEIESIFSLVGKKSYKESPQKLETRRLKDVCGSEMQILKDFDSFYSLLHSLCMNGELGKANMWAKLLMKY